MFQANIDCTFVRLPSKQNPLLSARNPVHLPHQQPLRITIQKSVVQVVDRQLQVVVVNRKEFQQQRDVDHVLDLHVVILQIAIIDINQISSQNDHDLCLGQDRLDHDRLLKEEI